MWKTSHTHTYPFRHKHINHFPPSPIIDSFNNSEDEESWFQSMLSPSPSEEEVPIVFYTRDILPSATSPPLTPLPLPPELQLLRNTSYKRPKEEGRGKRVEGTPEVTERNWRRLEVDDRGSLISPRTIQNYDINQSDMSPPTHTTPPATPISFLRSKPQLIHVKSNPRLVHLTPPPITITALKPDFSNLEPPPTPSSLVPAHLTTLLQTILQIMNEIMASQGSLELEDDVLKEMTELVVIMQEEAEGLVEMADLVEEYGILIKEEFEVESIENWAEELSIEGLDEVVGGVKQEREDSGVGLEFDVDDDDDVLDGLRREEGVVDPCVRIQFAKVHKREDLEVPLMSGGLGPQDLPRTYGGDLVGVGGGGARVVKPDSRRRVSYGRKSIYSSTKSSRLKGRKEMSGKSFRDSGLGLGSPVGSMNRSPKKNVKKWI